MTGGKKGCVLLHYVNKKRSELHPDWLPVRVTEDYEIVWQDVARPVDAEDFHALKSTVEGLIASKAELEKRVLALEAALQAQKSEEEPSTSTANTGNNKRKTDDANDGSKKKSKKTKGQPSAQASTSTASSK